METVCNPDTLANKSPSTTKETYKSDIFFAGVIEQIFKFFEDEIYCDVTLISKDGKCKVQAHKMVLSAASKYFLAMFRTSLRESSESEVNFPEIDGYSLNLVINYIYTASIELTTDTVEEIVKTAHLFELESLQVLCCDFIAKQLDPSNCVGIALLAEQYELKKLYGISEKFMCHNFDKVQTEKEFFDLDVDHLSKFLCNNELRAATEEDIFECLNSWIEHDKTNRKQFMETLLHCIRLPLIRPSFIAGVIEPACESIESERLLYKAMKWHILPDQRSSLFNNQFTETRIFSHTLTAISGWNSDNSNGLKVGLFNFDLNEWTYKSWPAPQRRRTNFDTTLFQGKLFLAGGNPTNRISSVLDSIECFDLDTLHWTESKPMKVARHSFGITTLNDSLYVFGGRNGNNYYAKSMEKWNPNSNEWDLINSELGDILSDQRCSGKCYLFTKQGTLCAAVKTSGDMVFHTYDPSTTSWNKFWLTFSGDFLGAGTVVNAKEKLFVVVGRQLILKINHDTQEQITIDCISEQFTRCEVFGDKIVFFGDKEFKVYYPFTNKWRTIPPLDNNDGRVVLISNY